MTTSHASHRLTPAEAAKELTVGAQTIRRWCEWHAAHLSKGANPPPGAPRYLTWQDLEVFKAVKTMREEGLPTLTINERLENLVIPIVDTPAPIEAETLTITTQPESPTENQMVTAVMTTLSTVLQRMDGIEKRQEEREKQTWNIRMVFLFGVITGVFLMFGFILVALFMYR